MSRTSVRQVSVLLGLLAVYLLAGKLGLSLAFINANASAVWPPTGIALAAFLLFGRRVWPAIFLGAFLVNITTAGNVATSAGIAIGNTLEGFVGASLVGRIAGGRNVFLRPNDVFRFALLVIPISAAISATIGVTTLAFGGFAAWSNYVSIWLTWWLGDVSGALVVTPALLLWTEPWPRWTRAQLLEAGLVLITLSVTAVIAFGGLSRVENAQYPFICMLPLIWAAFRLGPRETATAGLLLSFIAIRSTLEGSGPFVRPSPNDSLLLLQAFLAVSILMAQAVAASVHMRKEAEARVRKLNNELEELVTERTAQLLDFNRELSREVAEHQRAAEELTRSEARLNEAQHIAHVGSWEWDIEQNRLLWSDELYRIYGLDQASLTGSYEGFLERLHPEDQNRVEGIVEQANRDHRPFAFEHRIVRPDGSVRTLFSQGHVIVDEQGRPRAMVGAAQDVTDRKRIEVEREQFVREHAARREAEEANRLKDEFLAVLSHELRTPLNAILGWAQLLKAGDLDQEKSEKAVEIILRNVQAQTQIFADILDVSRIVSGKIQLELRDVDMHALVEAVRDGLRPAAESRGVVLELTAEVVTRPVLGDPVRLQEIVWNILSNAIKFSPAGKGRVEIRIHRTGEELEINVQDNGPGIPPDFLPHVFERFRQADSSTTRRHGGLGLGLAIVRHLVELHRGKVSVRNRTDGTGAIFSVLLPLSPGGRMPAPVDASAQEEAATDPLQGVRVLVVDDETDARDLIRVLLERWGATVIPAASAREALLEIQRAPPDVVITDIGMPIEDGYALLRQVRELSSRPAGLVPVVALTAYASADETLRLLRAGFHVHLTKPLQSAELKQVMIDLTRRGRSKR